VADARYTPLEALPADFAATCGALHTVAEQLVAPARKPDNEIALQATPGGFGTPVFEWEGEDCQVRVDGADLLVSRGSEEKRAPITTLADGAELIGHDLFSKGPPADATALAIDPAAAEQLGRWYALGDAVLSRLREDWAGEDPSEVNLWPEHFDIAIEAGDEGAGRRANYGFSPGDAGHDQPYLYVGPWSAEVSGELWNAAGFKGAELAHADLVEAADQLETALEFCRTRKAALERE
jgi:hypothetical protein